MERLAESRADDGGSPGVVTSGSSRERAESVARIAAAAAESVDREARFPRETFDALRAARLLGMQIPAEFGGEGASMSDVVDVCYMLGRSCGASAMIFSMHQIMVAILIRHARTSDWHQEFMREIAREQLLVASSTTENQTGGDVRSSACCVDAEGQRMTLSKNATVMSYGAEAEALLTTARRSAQSAASDQVLVALRRADYTLHPVNTWNVMGMRGTCSTGFALAASGQVEQVLPTPYEKIHTYSMMPVAHLTWGATWCGIAAGAVAKARQFVRNAARHSGGQMPPGTAHLTQAVMSLRALRGQLASALRRFEAAELRAEVIESLDFQTSFNLLKVQSSEGAIETVMSALRASGIAGYREDGDFSISRSLRDVLSSSIMINNDRILANATQAATLVDVPAFLQD